MKLNLFMAIMVDIKKLKIKAKLYGDKLNTNFQGKKVPKENASLKC